MGRSFVEIPTQQEGGVATREPIQAIKEQPAQIAGRRELADPFDVSLPAQQGSGSQPAVLRHVIDLLEPATQTIIQLHERKRSFGIEVGQKLFSNRAEEALDFSSPFRLIGWRVCDHHADGGGNARQLGAAKLLRVVHIKAHGDATRGNRLSQAIEESMQSLFSIKLSMGDQPAGVVQDGIQEGLHPSATGALNVRPEQKVGLPDLVTKLRFELLAGSRSQQLPRGEATLLEKAVQGGTGNRADGGDQSQFSQQRGAGTVWVLSFQSFDQLGQLWGEGARLPAVPTGLRRQGGKTATATVRKEKTRPAQQVHTQLCKQEAMSRRPTDRFEHVQSTGQKICRDHDRRQTRQSRAQSHRLLLKTANPELTPLIGHVSLPGGTACFS